MHPRSRPAPRSSGLSVVLHELARVVVPLACAGCGVPDVVLCTQCGPRFEEVPRRVESAAPRLDLVDGGPLWPVWAATAYTGPVRDVVVAWKDHGRTDLTRDLRTTMARLAGEVRPTLEQLHAGPLRIVPVPSSGAARRRRGREPVVELARAVATGAGAPLVRGLAHRSRVLGVRDQVGLGSRARAGNVSRSVRPTRRAPEMVGAGCVLVDDVLTTGATLAECSRAVTMAGGRVVAALVLAATPAPGGTSPAELLHAHLDEG